jgi:hypothetical protein
MDWIRNNRFMAGFLAFMVVGVAVLSYLLYSSYSNYDEVAQQYDRQVAELKRLQQLRPFPDAAGLKKFTDLRENYATSVNTLQAKLAAYEPPPENPPLTPIQFADKLRKVVEDVTTAAQTVGMALPENFYMGFEQYRGAPPDAAAAPLLSRELDLIDDLVGMLLKQHVEKLIAITRGRLPHEAGSSLAPPPPGNAPGLKTAVAQTGPELIVRYPVDISFSSQPSAFRDILNQVTAAKELFIVRALTVKNQSDKAPLREDPNAAVVGGVEPTAPAAPEPPGTDPNGVPIPALPKKGPPPLRYVVGLEKVDADLRIELVKVQPPAPLRNATR